MSSSGLGYITVRNVIPESIIEEDGLLSHYADLCPQRRQRDLAGIDAVNENCPLADFIKTGEEIDKRRLSCAAHTNQCDNLSRLRIDVDVLKHQISTIGETDITEFDAAFYRRQDPSSSLSRISCGISIISKILSAATTPRGSIVIVLFNLFTGS